MTTHSPAPWTMPYPRMGFSEIRDANGDLVFGVAAGLENEKRPDDVIDANAALIIAAPSLLLACKAIATINDSPMGTAYELHRVISEALAAIAKAEGKSP